MKLESKPMTCHFLRRWALAFSSLAWLLGSAGEGDAQAPAGAASSKLANNFNRDIRPILSENCYTCHGPDKNKRKAGLRLDRQEEAFGKLESGADHAIVPGDTAKSKLLQLVSSESDEDRMPPAKTGKRLSKEQIERLRAWIAAGAPWEKHWAYITPAKVPLPQVKNQTWPRNEIDHFVLARLEREGLNPAPEAERPTLIRRASIDLIGLPPTVAEVDAFLADESPQAYEKVVDRLLASQHFGERMAQQWLDLARYADSDGYHADAPRSMWQFRDYVINSFNANKPFDEFTIEQLAGDLLPNSTLDQKVATAFNRNGMSSTEGGADPDEYMNKYVTDRVNTTSTVWLGSTLGCAECHDHKYDGFTQKEYYQLYDFFNRIPEKGLESDPAPPFVKVPRPEQAAALAKFTAELTPLEAARKNRLERKEDSLDLAQAKWEERFRKTVMADWVPVEPWEISSQGGASFKKLEDKSVLAGGANPDKDTYEITLKTSLRNLTGIRLEALTDDSLPGKGASRGTNGNFVLTAFEAEAQAADASQEPGPGQGLDWGNWSLLGPFKAASAKEVFEKAFISESAIDLAQTYDEGKIKWTEKPDWKDGQVQAFEGENQVSYLYRTLTAKTARLLKISVGCDGGMQVWLNGAQPLGNKIVRGVVPDPDEILLHLKAGENKLLLKLHHGNGAFGFYFVPQAEPVSRYPVEFTTAAADYNQKDFGVRSALDGKPETGWAVDGQEEKKRVDRQALFVARYPIDFATGAILKVRLKFESANKQAAIGRFRLAVTGGGGLDEFAGLPQGLQTAFFAEGANASEEQKKETREFYRENFSPEIKDLNQKLAGLRNSQKELNARIPTIRVMEEMPEPRGTQIRVRGDYRNKGEKVSAGVPHSLPPLPPETGTNRLALARWLVDPDHPLVSRVTVNRYWQEAFGTGLVKTGNEFGAQGELPSHPELLDWLARDFIDSGWNIKATLKKMVVSATYRQSSKTRPELLTRDPSNRMLARGPRFRMPAEVIRDNALVYSGLLERQVGGPSVHPYQPAGLWEDKMFGGNKYDEGKGPELYRRSVYTLWKRTVLNPTLMTFDAPDRALCTDQRSMTCTPLQAFVTMNDKIYVETARVFAQRVMREGGETPEDRLNYAYKVVLARTPNPKERKVLTDIYEEMTVNYQKDLKSAVDLITAGDSKRAENLNELQLVAWTAVANVIFNLDETVTKE